MDMSFFAEINAASATDIMIVYGDAVFADANC